MRALALLALLLAGSVNAAPTCVLIGDSIMSAVFPSTVNGPQGSVQQSAPHIIQNEGDVYIRNISSPGAALGASDFTGFGNVKPTIDMISGVFKHYDCIIVQAGTNDFGRSIHPDVMSSSLNTILSTAKAAGKKVLVVDLTYRHNENTPNTAGFNLHTYRMNRAILCMGYYPDICTYANRTGGVFDTYDPTLYDAKEVADGKALHLNAKGNREYANWVISVAKQNNVF